MVMTPSSSEMPRTVQPADEDGGEMSRMCLVTQSRHRSNRRRWWRSGACPARRRNRRPTRHDQPLVALADLDALAVPELATSAVTLLRSAASGSFLQRRSSKSPVRRARSPHSRCSGRDCPAAPSRWPRRRIGRPHPQSVERHDEARRAEAALRAVEIDHRLLHGMQLASLAAQVFTVTTWQPSSEPRKRMQALTLS